MILDKQGELSNAQLITATAASTNQIDQGPPAYTGNSRGTNAGSIFFSIDADFAAAGAATLQAVLRSSASPDMSNPKIHLLTPAVPVASLKRGASLRSAGLQLPITEDTLRYIDVQYVVSTGPFTAGAISARHALSVPNSWGA